MDQEFLRQNIQYLSLGVFISFYSEWLEQQVEANDTTIMVQNLITEATNMMAELETTLKDNPLWQEISEGIDGLEISLDE
jgi:hypothetical protein